MSREEAEQLLKLDINEAYWKQKGTDTAWWYYESVLPEGAVSEPLLESVAFDGKEMGNSYQDCRIQIHVAAQAVQSDNNGATALAAVGWPEE